MDYTEMMKKKNNLSILLITGTILVGILVSAIVILPLYNSASSVTKEADQKTTELASLKSKKSVLDGLKDQEAQLKKSAGLVTSALPTDSDVGGLFIQVDALASQSGGKVLSITGASAAATTTATKTGFSGIQKYTYSVPVSFPNYFALKDFINGSKSALRLLNIDDIGISASDTGSIQAIMNITAYTRK